MSWMLDHPAYMMLTAVLLFGLGLGAGLGVGKAAGRGLLLSQRLNGIAKGSTPSPYYCMETCREHSGLVADVKHLIKLTDEIKIALNDIMRELRNNRGGAA